ncbi:MAG: hydrogen gas-evolving membrane-bound hydrogenase subunit E [Actinomycetota bacterium]
MALVLAIIAHFAAGALMLVGLRRRPVAGAVVGLVVLAATAAVTVTQGIGADSPLRTTVEWIPLLGFNFSFALDGFAVVMALLVSVLGFGVLAYSIGYFEHDSTFARFVGLFMAFAGSMTGLVLAADLFTMFIFWELTSICSFLLIGLNDKSASARQSAVRALLTTGAGGLCLLGGVALLQVEFGTTSFAQLAVLSPSGTLAEVAAVLLLLGAFTKSAQFPFHFWLPGAMAAPTPVSAYLHSATMVKAGLVLLARTSPIFADQGVWRWWVVVAGVITMLIGGWQALRQVDAKLLLAHSTVSQLGLLTVLFGVGSPLALYAGVAHLVAHAVFKAGLFLGVGVIDHEIGTRDVSKIGRARARIPATVAAIAACTLSMAGIIPLLGFVTKEKALVALLDSDIGSAGTFALWGVVAGSVLSVAYSVRLLRAVVGAESQGARTPDAHNAAEHGEQHHHASRLVTVLLSGPVVLTACASVVFGVAASQLGKWLVAPATSLDADAKSKLVLWPGINTALIISVVVIVVGAIVGWRAPLAVSAGRGSRGERAFDGVYDAVMVAAKRITATTQSGSLPMYVGVMVALIAAAPITALLIDGNFPTTDIVNDSPLTVVIVVLAVVLALGAVLVQMRFAAALFLGGVGYAVAVLFAMRGAIDLALTQLLVETLSVVIFLLALRVMPQRFSPSSRWNPRSLRVAIAAAVGIAVPLFALAVNGAGGAPSVSQEYFARSVDEAGGRNVVNVILVDFRGFDTMGEITVLAVAALGVANLVRAAERERRNKTTNGAGR